MRSSRIRCLASVLLFLLLPLTANARWYHTGTGRFLSADPVGAEQYLGTPNELNPWNYASVNPLRYTDPTGECSATALDERGNARTLLCAAESQQEYALMQRQQFAKGSPEYEAAHALYLDGLAKEQSVKSSMDFRRNVFQPVFLAASEMALAPTLAALTPAALVPWLTGLGVFTGSMGVTEAVRGEQISISPVRALIERSTDNLITVSAFSSNNERYLYGGTSAVNVFLGVAGAGAHSIERGQPLFSPTVTSKVRPAVDFARSLRLEFEPLDLDSNVRGMAMPGMRLKAVSPTGVQPYQVGKYKDLVANSKVGDRLDLDHQPSHASNVARAEAMLGRALTQAENNHILNEGMAVAVPQKWHRQLSPTYGGRNQPPQIQADAANPRAAVKRDTNALVSGASSANKDKARAAAKLLRDAAKKL